MGHGCDHDVQLTSNCTDSYQRYLFEYGDSKNKCFKLYDGEGARVRSLLKGVPTSKWSKNIEITTDTYVYMEILKLNISNYMEGVEAKMWSLLRDGVLTLSKKNRNGLIKL